MLRSSHNRVAKRQAMLNANMRRQQALRGELLLNISHDLRTPLTSVQGYLETLVTKTPQLSAADLQQYLEVALRQSQRAVRLTEGLFELAQFETQEARPKFERFCLQELAQDVVQKFQFSADLRQISIIVDFLPEIPAVEADIGMIERALSALFENVLLHTPQAGQITIVLECEANRVWFSVWNNGAANADRNLLAIFESELPLPYHPGQDQIGLLIAKRIMQLHNAAIELVNEPQGATFKFSLRALGMK